MSTTGPECYAARDRMSVVQVEEFFVGTDDNVLQVPTVEEYWGWVVWGERRRESARGEQLKEFIPPPEEIIEYAWGIRCLLEEEFRAYEGTNEKGSVAGRILRYDIFLAYAKHEVFGGEFAFA